MLVVTAQTCSHGVCVCFLFYTAGKFPQLRWRGGQRRTSPRPSGPNAVNTHTFLPCHPPHANLGWVQRPKDPDATRTSAADLASHLASLVYWIMKWNTLKTSHSVPIIQAPKGSSIDNPEFDPTAKTSNDLKADVLLFLNRVETCFQDPGQKLDWQCWSIGLAGSSGSSSRAKRLRINKYISSQPTFKRIQLRRVHEAEDLQVLRPTLRARRVSRETTTPRPCLGSTAPTMYFASNVFGMSTKKANTRYACKPRDVAVQEQD